MHFYGCTYALLSATTEPCAIGSLPMRFKVDARTFNYIGQVCFVNSSRYKRYSIVSVKACSLPVPLYDMTRRRSITTRGK